MPIAFRAAPFIRSSAIGIEPDGSWRDSRGPLQVALPDPVEPPGPK